MSGSWLSFDIGVWPLLLIFCLALRVSPRRRGTLLQQPKRVPRKGRHYHYAPVENTGVPTDSAQSSCCEKTRAR